MSNDAEAIARIIDPGPFTALDRTTVPVAPEEKMYMDAALTKAERILSYLASRREAEPVEPVHMLKVPLPSWLGPDTPENRARLQAFVEGRASDASLAGPAMTDDIVARLREYAEGYETAAIHEMMTEGAGTEDEVQMSDLSKTLSSATAALSADLGDMVLVPKEATEAMLKVAVLAIHSFAHSPDRGFDQYNWPWSEEAMRVYSSRLEVGYRAMIAAAEDSK